MAHEQARKAGVKDGVDVLNCYELEMVQKPGREPNGSGPAEKKFDAAV